MIFIILIEIIFWFFQENNDFNDLEFWKIMKKYKFNYFNNNKINQFKEINFNIINKKFKKWIKIKIKVNKIKIIHWNIENKKDFYSFYIYYKII